MSWIQISFWTSFIILFYVFIGYGFIIFLLVIINRLFKSKVVNVPVIFEPPVTLIIPCYNEADILATKIANCKQLNYPIEKLEIVFITDGSTDNSETILKSWPEIKVLHQPKRSGKAAAENRAIKYVDTPFVVFSDANTFLNADSIRHIVKHFAKESVGCVSGEKRIFSTASDSASAAGEGAYWKYESLLKRLDSELNTAVGAAGELVAFRTELYTNLPEDTILDDFMQSMLIAAAGYKVVYEPSAYAMEPASENVEQELKRKVRICAGGWQSIVRLRGKLSMFKHPLLFFQYISHRVLRWTITPFLLILVFVLNIKMDMYVSGIYQISVVAQFAFYTIAMVGLILKDTNLKYKQIFVPYYFCLMNYAVLAGLIKYLTGSQTVSWDKAKRKVILLEKA